MKNHDMLLNEAGVREWAALADEERDKDEYRFIAVAVRVLCLAKKQAAIGPGSSSDQLAAAYPFAGLLATAENDGLF